MEERQQTQQNLERLIEDHRQECMAQQADVAAALILAEGKHQSQQQVVEELTAQQVDARSALARTEQQLAEEHGERSLAERRLADLEAKARASLGAQIQLEEELRTQDSVNEGLLERERTAQQKTAEVKTALEVAQKVAAAAAEEKTAAIEKALVGTKARMVAKEAALAGEKARLQMEIELVRDEDEVEGTLLPRYFNRWRWLRQMLKLLTRGDGRASS